MKIVFLTGYHMLHQVRTMFEPDFEGLYQCLKQSDIDLFYGGIK